MTSEVTQADGSATYESDPQVDNSLSGRLARANSTLRALEKILGFEFDGPCPICSGIEGCSHSLRERVEATRLTAQSGEGRAFDRDWCINMARKEAGYEIGAGVLAMDPDLSGEGRSGAGEDARVKADAELVAEAVAQRCSVGFNKDGSPKSPTRYATIWQAARLGAIEYAALNARQTGEGEREKFLTAYVSEDCKIIGIEHDSDADWHKVHDAHIALWNRLEERIRDREKCPRKPALRATDDAGGA